MDPTHNLLKGLSFGEKFERQLKIKMLPKHIRFFLKNFVEYVDKEVDELSPYQQKSIYNVLILLKEEVEDSKKSYSSSSSRKYDFRLIKNIQGPLVVEKKLEFLQSVKNIMEELLTSKALTSTQRQQWIFGICTCSSHIPNDLVLSWMISSQGIEKVN